MLMIRPFRERKPIDAAIRVERPREGASGSESRLFARVLRRVNDDLYSLKYAFDLPVCLSMHESRQRRLYVYGVDQDSPAISRSEIDPEIPPQPFPPEVSTEPPVVVSGISCFYRTWTGPSQTYTSWYSYEYSASVRDVIEREGHGATTWYLDQVTLGEAVEAKASEFELVSLSDMKENVWKVAARIFGGL